MHPRSSSAGYVLIVTNTPFSRWNDAGTSMVWADSPRVYASTVARAIRTASWPSASVYIVRAIRPIAHKDCRAWPRRSVATVSLYATTGYDCRACDEGRATPRARGHDERRGHRCTGPDGRAGGVGHARPWGRQPDRRRGREGGRHPHGARHRDEGRCGGPEGLHAQGPRRHDVARRLRPPARGGRGGRAPDEQAPHPPPAGSPGREAPRRDHGERHHPRVAPPRRGHARVGARGHVRGGPGARRGPLRFLRRVQHTAHARREAPPRSRVPGAMILAAGSVTFAGGGCQAASARPRNLRATFIVHG